MSLPKSRLAYVDCLEIMDRAIESPTGLRVKMASADAAIHFRMRCQHARRIVRVESLAVYEPGDPKYGVSQYDSIIIRIRHVDDMVWCYFEPISASRFEAEPIPEEDESVPLADLGPSEEQMFNVVESIKNDLMEETKKNFDEIIKRRL